MQRLLTLVVFVVSLGLSFMITSRVIFARVTPAPTQTPSPTEIPAVQIILTESRQETLGPLEKILKSQEVGDVWFNPVKHAIRNAVAVGVPANTIVLLLLLPVIALVIAASRHLIGLRGFGIFLPASLAVTFVATGPIVGIGLFLAIVAISVVTRYLLNKFKLRLQYLPRMALLLWVVAVGILGILFAAPLINSPEIINVSIFPVLILILLTEDFTRVQIGKSVRIALNLTAETLILALISYFFLTLKPLQSYALLNPEITLISVFIADLTLGRFIGLRLLEYWRFRKLINQ